LRQTCFALRSISKYTNISMTLGKKNSWRTFYQNIEIICRFIIIWYTELEQISFMIIFQTRKKKVNTSDLGSSN
jgi:hypothetical protein